MKTSLRIIILVLVVLSILISSCVSGDIDERFNGSHEISLVPAEESSQSPEASEIASEEQSEISEASEVSDGSRFELPEYSFDDKGHGTTKFTEMVYTRPDFASIEREIGLVDKAVDEGVLSEDEMLGEVERLNDIIEYVSTEITLLYIKSSLDTTDDFLQKENETVTALSTEIQRAYNELLNKIIDSKYGKKVTADWTEFEIEQVRQNSKLIDDEYTEIAKRLTKLRNTYNDNYSLNVMIDGKRMTLEQVYDKYGIIEYYNALSVVTADIYLEIVKLEKRIAEKAGARDAISFIYKNNHNRDYTPDDVKAFRESVKNYIVPVAAMLEDGSFNVNGECTVYTYIDKVREYCMSVSPEMAEAFEHLMDMGMYLSGNDEEMQTADYTSFLYSYGQPIIVQKLTGSYRDLVAFTHEFGHYYAYYRQKENANENTDICEIHSQTNELLFMPVYEKIFGKREYAKLKQSLIGNNVSTIITSCIISEFEEEVFKSSFTTSKELSDCFSRICTDYGMGYLPGSSWAAIPHIFLQPMYYISYAASLVPALEIYAESVDDYQSGIDLYNKLVEKSNRRIGFMELLDEIGLDNPFSSVAVKKIAEALKK